VQLLPDGQSSTATVVGNMLGINVGECVALTGAWVAHSQYGRQFKAESVQTVLPATVAGIERYLGSGMIKGVGPVTAKRIVRKFGAETLTVIEQAPERLLEVLGVGRKRVDMIARAWAEQQKIKEVMLFLQSHNVSTGLAVRIYKRYGDDAVEIVKNDPYRLAREVYGIGFLTADKIARELGIAHDAPERVAAGVAYVLSQAADEGNTYLPEKELTKRGAELLGVSEAQAGEGIRTLLADEQVWVEGEKPSWADERSVRAPVTALAEERPVYLLPFYYGEVGVTARLRRLAEASADRLAAFASFNWPAALALLAAGAPNHQTLTAKQMEVVQAALTQRVVVLTGGPGTGKTFSVRSIIRLAEAAGVRIALASPTGRAAKRLAETTGRQAKTLHRLLEFKPGEGGGLAFQRNEENPLDADLVIVDEASMLDLLLTNHLLKAIPPGAHLLFVGDIDQLPSVGAGNVLRDIIAAIEEGDGLPNAAVIRLDTIFRQAEGSYIITNAHRINQGQMPVLDNKNSKDFFIFTEEDAEKAAALVVEIVRERIPRKFGLAPDQIQVLSPMHRGAVGVGNLNAALQAALNPYRPTAAERQVGGRTYRVGDRVMQIRNNYDKEVFNGDMGQILDIDLEEQAVTVRMDERTVRYDFLELDELIHAYAVSVHKSQGSEFPAVVIPLLPTHYMMLQRNLLYTAVTRAQKLVVLVGAPRAIAIAVRNDRAHQRYSGLAERLGLAA
jgi:exodeoxyribonuclease V alpha subunit